MPDLARRIYKKEPIDHKRSAYEINSIHLLLLLLLLFLSFHFISFHFKETCSSPAGVFSYKLFRQKNNNKLKQTQFCKAVFYRLIWLKTTIDNASAKYLYNLFDEDYVRLKCDNYLWDKEKAVFTCSQHILISIHSSSVTPSNYPQVLSDVRSHSAPGAQGIQHLSPCYHWKSKSKTYQKVYV